MANPAWSNVWGLWHCEIAAGAVSAPNVVYGGAALSGNFGNGASGTTSKFKFGAACLAACGTGSGGSYWLGPSSLNLTAKLTIEAWIYVPSTTPAFTAFAFNGAGGLNDLTFNAAGDVSINGSTLAAGAAAGRWTANAWHHVAWVVNLTGATKNMVFINGSLITSSASALISGSAGQFWLGAATTGFYADEIRGCYEALYTSTFAPPTTQFPETQTADGASSGVGAASGAGRRTVLALGSASGIATPSGAGRATVQASAAAAGTSTASGAARVTYTRDASAVGTSLAQAVPQLPSDGLAACVGTALGAAFCTAESYGTAVQFATASAFWRLTTAYPRVTYAYTMGQPIGPNTKTAKPRSIQSGVMGYPVAFHLKP